MFWFIVLYGITAIGIGAYNYLHCSSKSKYILCDRQTNGHSAGLTSQTILLGYLLTMSIPMSVMSEDIGLVGAIFSLAGMICGIFLSRFIISRRLRIYSELAKNSLSFPEYLENRFRDRSGILRAVCASVILIFSIIFTASVIDIAADILNGFTNMGRISAIVVCGLLVAVFIFLGGLSSIIKMGHIRALLILLFFIFIILLGINSNIFISKTFFAENILSAAARTVSESKIADGLAENILNFISYAVLFFGIPTINAVYMSTKERRVPKRWISYEFIWIIPSAIGSIFLGVITKSLAQNPVTNIDEYIKVLTDNSSTLIGSIIISLIFVVCLATTEFAVFSAGTAFSYDLFEQGTNKKIGKNVSLLFTRTTPVAVTVISVIYAISGPSSSFSSFEFIIMLMSSAFGPTTLFSLYCKKMTTKAAVISITGGIICACISNYFLPTLGVSVIMGIIPSFIVGTLIIFIISRFDGINVSNKTENEFGRTKEIAKMK